MPKIRKDKYIYFLIKRASSLILQYLWVIEIEDEYINKHYS